jgi:hypothetical protein
MNALDGVAGDGFEHPGKVGAAVDVVAVEVEKQVVGAAEAFGDGVGVGFRAQTVNFGSDAGGEDLEELELVLGGMERRSMKDGEGAKAPTIGGVETVADVGLGGELLEDGCVRESFLETLVDAEEVSFEDVGTRRAGGGIEDGNCRSTESPDGEGFKCVRDGG